MTHSHLSKVFDQVCVVAKGRSLSLAPCIAVLCSMVYPLISLAAPIAPVQLEVDKKIVSTGLQSWHSDYFEAQDALLVQTHDGTVIASQNADSLRTPASTLKVVTALMAVEKWGVDYRWPTLFRLEGAELTVVGSADPLLVSEELSRVAANLAVLVKQPIERIVLNHSLLENAAMPGRSKVNDPYNAPVSALAANFNTGQLRRTAQGFEQGEAQTPLTRTAFSRAQEVVKQEPWALNTLKRVNLKTVENAQRNFAELLLAILAQSDTSLVAKEVEIVSSQTPLSEAGHGAQDYLHYNSQTLDQVLIGMLKYSNNFAANQLFLSLGIKPSSSTGVSFLSAASYVEQWLKSRFGWQDFSIVEGSGLSTDNRVSASQLNDVLAAFSNHRELLPLTDYPVHKARAFAKTGTLSGVRSMAGYVVIGEQRYRFSYFFNRAVPWRHRESTLDALVAELATIGQASVDSFDSAEQK